VPTCRTAIREALRAVKAIAPGDDPDIDELDVGMQALLDVTLDLHEARGPMRNVDIPVPTWQNNSWYWPPSSTTIAWVAGENQRCRIQQGFIAEITLPNSIWIFPEGDPYDYDFHPFSWAPSPGSVAPADGLSLRPPRDGTRIEVVGATQSLWFYRADLNEWMAGYGLDRMPNNGITLDGEIPFNGRYASALGSLVAERLIETLPDLDEPTTGLSRRIARGREALMLRVGTERPAVRAEYF
jgi:hypothetical protein